MPVFVHIDRYAYSKYGFHNYRFSYLILYLTVALSPAAILSNCLNFFILVLSSRYIFSIMVVTVSLSMVLSNLAYFSPIIVSWSSL